ncbi:unnamed protein product, partial [Linum tenue]
HRGSQGKGRSSRERVFQLAFGVIGGLVLAIGVAMALVCKTRLRNWRRLNAPDLDISNESDNLLLAQIGIRRFSLQELEQATNGFSNLLGKGTFGVVYKGTLDDGSEIAVKELLKQIESYDDDNRGFANEVRVISKIKHRNLLPLQGYCDDTKERRRFLVYEFMANGSVADHLSNVTARMQFCWEQRKNVILDVAKAICYLHCGVKPAIYHRDIKSSNVLLDSDLRAKVGDFGLARQVQDDGSSHVTTRLAGTHGYLAPEYAMYGRLTEKNDVYSFGILILEIVSARKVIDNSNFSSSSSSAVVLITDWAWNLVKSGNVDRVFDETLMSKDEEYYCRGEMRRFVLAGILCAHVVADLRPTMAEALRLLEGDVEVPKLPDRPPPLSRESLSSSSVVRGLAKP